MNLGLLQVTMSSLVENEPSHQGLTPDEEVDLQMRREKSTGDPSLPSPPTDVF